MAQEIFYGTENNINYVYRYRSLDSPYISKELSNLEIYFAKPNELNDQMEDYLNIVWRGDEIAFQGLFKHYLYTLSNLFTIASLKNKGEHIDSEHLPIFISAKDLETPKMKTSFRNIYFEFFNSKLISNIPRLMANSNKKFSADEILLLFKSIHLYAYLVVQTQLRKHIWNENLLQNEQYNKMYNYVKNWQNYELIINTLLSESYDKNEILKIIDSLNMQEIQTKTILEKTHYNKDTYNINILSFDFPNHYVKQIKNILYNNFCVTSFTSTFRNEPMWAHYANNENGICLQFKIKNKNNSKFLNLYTVSGVLSDSKGTKYIKNYFDNKLFKVEYTNNYPEIDFFSSLGCLPLPVILGFWLCDYDQKNFSSYCKKYNKIEEWRTEYHRMAEKYICTKAKNWEYEEEYRIFYRDILGTIYETKQNRIAKYNIEDLNAIIFGRKVSTNKKIEIFKIINEHCKANGLKDLKFYDLYYSTITKQLETKPCNTYVKYFVSNNT